MRRRWSAEAKARIIASSFEPGANIAEIARTHGLLPQQLYAWRR
ncbi:transposase [Sphingobium soli]|uniref:Transposase n=1 Tax=Sphingobium soli TaxID=1591116 RepID=A0ABS8H6B3_9SPHN|nr:transposase [Sphingobium soli]